MILSRKATQNMWLYPFYRQTLNRYGSNQIWLNLWLLFYNEYFWEQDNFLAWLIALSAKTEWTITMTRLCEEPQGKAIGEHIFSIRLPSQETARV